MSSSQSWTVVIFEEDQTVQAVPTKWIVGDRCLWPIMTQDKLNMALKNCEVNTSWPSQTIRILRNSTFGDYALARAKAKKAEFISDLSTDTEGQRRRKIGSSTDVKSEAFAQHTRKKRLFSSSDSSGSENDISNKMKKNKRLRSLPPPPKKNLFTLLSEEEICIDNTTMSHSSPSTSLVDRPVLGSLENTPSRSLRSSPGPSSVPAYSAPDTPSIARSSNKTKRECSTMACNNQCGVCCKKNQDSRFIYVMTSLLVELNGKVDQLLKSQVSRGEAVEEIGILAKANIEFPIGDKVILDEFNAFLEEQGIYSGMVKYFSKIGGNNLSEFVKRCLAPIIRDDLAMQFTYLGRSGKYNFGASNLSKAIVDASEKTNLITNRKETEISIGGWLRRAPERKRRSSMV